MLHHIEYSRLELERVLPLLVGTLAQIGYEESGHWDSGFTLANGHDAYLTFVQVAEGHAFRLYHRCGVGLNHLAFKVKGRETIDILRQYCLANDITSLYDDKYPFANGGTDYYALFIEDPDRIKVEFVAV